MGHASECERCFCCEDDLLGEEWERDPVFGAEELTKNELGRRGEEAAARYLKMRGFEILERNWICFAGEADIIAREGDTLVFVEVKTRRHTRKGFPSEAVTAKKRHRYENIALAYVADYPDTDIPVRFDVVSMVVIAPDRALIRHHVNAFGTP